MRERKDRLRTWSQSKSGNNKVPQEGEVFWYQDPSYYGDYGYPRPNPAEIWEKIAVNMVRQRQDDNNSD